MELVNQDQHYVPRGLLKKFADTNGDFFQIRHIYKPTVKPTNISKVCYGVNFYDAESLEFLKENGIDDLRFLEGKGFWYENVFNQIIQPYETKQKIITSTELENFIDMFLNIKYRNVAMRKKMDDLTFRSNILDGVKKNMTKKYEGGINGERIVSVIEKVFSEFKPKHLADKNFAKESHLRGLVHAAQKRNQAVNDTVWKLLGMEVIVFSIKDEKQYFLVSDNPGFTFFENNDLNRTEIYNTDYARMSGVVFPFSSKMAIMLVNFNRSNQFKKVRNITYRTATDSDIDLFNYGTKMVSNERIFCMDKQFLEAYVLKDKNGKEI